MDNNHIGSSPGNTLGGGGGNNGVGVGAAPSLSPADLRRKRLEALEKRSSPSVPAQAASQQLQPQTKERITATIPRSSASSSNENHDNPSSPSSLPPAPASSASQSSSNVVAAAPPMATSTPPPVTGAARDPPGGRHNNPFAISNQQEEDADFDDEDLQRALALSMAGDTTDEDTDDSMQNNNTNFSNKETTTTPEQRMQESLHINASNKDNNNKQSSPFEATNPMMMMLSNSTKSVQASSSCNSLDFHYIMWDYPGITTENDQRRWLSQGIDFKYIDAHLEACQTNTTTADSILAAVLLHYESWGLTQTHGGPCGVLAAIQAEMLRLLLFGPRTVAIANYDDDDGKEKNNDDDTVGLDYPTNSNNDLFNAPADLHPRLLRKALAMSMAIIWTRTSMASPAAASDSKEGTTDSSSSAVSNTTPTSASTAMDLTTSSANSNPSVKIVLPKMSIQTASLEWNHMEPWTSDTGGSGQSDSLETYTISLHDDDSDDRQVDNHDQNLSTHNASSQQPHTKRPRVKSIGRENSSYFQNEELQMLYALSNKVANFLCDTNALEWFQRPGGVLLMVMSLAASRGIPNIQGDMDDPTAKLTSNFGHCSQELINLLLTGQAVSNVFDNTMRPSGELICRGIQARPAIGYLSQLESMRYLEVGGYYKTPQFPIWVIGSTSHFTVLFGDASCLKESASDVLLEKVRRAFKRIDENETGFIQTQQLQQFLNLVGLTPKTVSENAIPTLAATMEVHGAGIILWEDLWKRTSRLLTGASLETVLAWNGESDTMNASSVTSTAIVPVPDPLPVASSGTDSFQGLSVLEDHLSDEELARRLQAEWNGEVIPAPAPPPPPPPAANPQVPTQQSQPTASAGQTEKYGNTFQLYHYNGLRGGNLKPFRVTRLSADEAIGASVPLGGNNHSNNHNMMMGGGAGGDLEDVLRSKWPSCKIDWINGSPPSID